MSIGRDHGIGELPVEIACVNWGVQTRKEAQEKMRDVVGCTKKNKDGSFIFDDSDRPGIIYLCSKWEMTGLNIYEKRTVRVRRIRPVSAFCQVQFKLSRNAELHEEQFRLFSADGAYDQTKAVNKDLVKNDKYFFIEFSSVPRGLSYSLELLIAGEEPRLVFKDVPCHEIHGHSKIDEITEVQSELNKRGYSCGSVDGKLGPMTIAAIKRFQKGAKLAASGEMDEKTVDALFSNW